MDLLELMQNRRSVRKYTDAHISENDLEKILQAGLLSASGRAVYPWELYVVRDHAILKKMAESRAVGAAMLEDADAAIVVAADPEKTDVWIEDCSIVMAHMHLMASSLGVGSCWVQGRLRRAADGRSTEEFLRDLLHIPENYKLAAILSLGMPDEQPPRHELEDLRTNKIHRM